MIGETEVGMMMTGTGEVTAMDGHRGVNEVGVRMGRVFEYQMPDGSQHHERDAMEIVMAGGAVHVLEAGTHRLLGSIAERVLKVTRVQDSMLANGKKSRCDWIVTGIWVQKTEARQVMKNTIPLLRIMISSS